jgi:hypothetical protein
MGAIMGVTNQQVGQNDSFLGLKHQIKSGSNALSGIKNGLDHRDNLEVPSVKEVYELYAKITQLFQSYGDLGTKDVTSFQKVVTNQVKIDERYGG